MLSSQANDKGGYDKPRSSLQYTVKVAAMTKEKTNRIGRLIAINGSWSPRSSTHTQHTRTTSAKQK